MQAPTHMMAAILLTSQAVGNHPVLLGISALAALTPDIDTPRSTLGRVLFFISYPLNRIFGHRGATHSLLVLFLSGAALAGVQIHLGGAATLTPLLAAWFLGYASHLALDSLTNGGLPLFWPYPRTFSVHLGTTGGVVELVLSTLLGLLFFYNLLEWLG